METSDELNKLRRKIKKLESGNKTLKRTILERDKMFSILSHDLIGPFNSLIGLTELLTSDDYNLPAAKQKECLQTMHEQAINVYSLAENLLSWSRTRVSQSAIAMADCDLKKIIDEITGVLKIEAKKKKIDLINKVPEGTIIYGNANIIGTIIRNLVSNSLKFTNPKGKISVSHFLNGNSLLVSVTDTGVGIAPKSLKKMFGINYSTPGTHNEKGTGLGLKFCQEMAERHGGKISFESKLGEGTRATLMIGVEKKN
ncbi:MAG: HAMP domain-containing sensor histidine kinase [Patescibacteria group bacterium]|jgi:signal transduction histidine kinase